MFDLTGRRALVIGGASGIGRASCFGLAAHGAHTPFADVSRIARRRRRRARSRQAAAGRSAAARLREAASVAAAAKTLGAPDVLVITPSINVRKPLLDLTRRRIRPCDRISISKAFSASCAPLPRPWRRAARDRSSLFQRARAGRRARARRLCRYQGRHAANDPGAGRRTRHLRRARQRRRARRRRDAAHPADQAERSLVSRLCRKIDAAALGRTRRKSPARSCSSAPTPVPMSPARICWSTAAGPPPTGASPRRCRRRAQCRSPSLLSQQAGAAPCRWPRSPARPRRSD